jgi:hypothetical protein
MPEPIDVREARHLACATVAARLQGRLPALHLTEIDAAALAAARAWPLASRHVTWDWTGIVKRRETGRLEVAIWWNRRLCGLAYGPMRGGALCLSRLEGDPEPAHPLKGRIVDIGIAILETQALILGIPETRLESPDPGLVERYRGIGYDWLVEKGVPRYLRKVRTFR